MTSPIQRLRDLLATATPGTWFENRGCIVGGPDDRPIEAMVVAVAAPGLAATRNGNAALIVAAVNALPALLDVVEAAVGAAKEEREHRAGPYCAQAAYASRQKLRNALAKLEGIK